MKKTLQGLALTIVTLALCAIVGELAVRVVYSRIADYNLEMWRYTSSVKVGNPNPRLPFFHAANRKGFYYGAEIQTNSFGFRDRDYPVQRVPGTKRIIMLGDSFALGWGVPFDSTFSKRLEGLFRDGGEPTEVINLGVGNYNTVMELELFREKGLQFSPDVVVLMYYVNDAEPTPAVVGPIKAALFSHSYLVAFIADRLIKLEPLIDPSRDWKAYYGSLYQPGKPGLQASRQALIDLATLCRERNIKLLVANIPELRELKRYPFPQATEFVRSVSAEQGVPFIDLAPSMVNEEPASLWVSAGDPHASVKANGIIARELYRAASQAAVQGPAGGHTAVNGKTH
jgi:hypothetical protein